MLTLALIDSVWLVFFVDSFQQQASFSLVPYVTSSFGTHGLVATTSIVSTLVAGVSKLPLSSILDVFGRNEGLALSLLVTIVGESNQRLQPPPERGPNE